MKNVRRFYLVESISYSHPTQYSWIECGDPYSEGHTWFNSPDEARKEAQIHLKDCVEVSGLEYEIELRIK